MPKVFSTSGELLRGVDVARCRLKTAPNLLSEGRVRGRNRVKIATSRAGRAADSLEVRSPRSWAGRVDKVRRFLRTFVRPPRSWAGHWKTSGETADTVSPGGVCPAACGRRAVGTTLPAAGPLRGRLESVPQGFVGDLGIDTGDHRH